MGGDERNPDDVFKQAFWGLAGLLFLALMFLWGCSALIEWISGHHQTLL